MPQDISGLFLLPQKDYNSFNTLGEATSSISYPQEGQEIFIISENKYYYWTGTTWADQAILFSTAAPDIGTLYCQESTALTTSNDGDMAVSMTINQVPYDGSDITVFANGHAVTVGDGVKTEGCYFSNNGGLTAKGFLSTHPNGKVAVGDTLHWNGSIVGYELDSADFIQIKYLI